MNEEPVLAGGRTRILERLVDRDRRPVDAARQKPVMPVGNVDHPARKVSRARVPACDDGGADAGRRLGNHARVPAPHQPPAAGRRGLVHHEVAAPAALRQRGPRRELPDEQYRDNRAGRQCFHEGRVQPPDRGNRDRDCDRLGRGVERRAVERAHDAARPDDGGDERDSPEHRSHAFRTACK